jgi:hypothetical protein
MAEFKEKAIFLWTYWDISDDPKVIADKLIEGGFEAVYVHCNDGPYEASYGQMQANGTYKDRLNCTDALVEELRSRGLVIYGWGAPYGVNTAAEIAMMVKQTRRYNLAGYIIDAEGTWDAQGDVISDTRKIITEYKAACPGVPVAWCWWPLFHVPNGTGVYHNKAILVEAMKYSDYAMPMAYWNWPLDVNGVKFVEGTVKQWREVTDKPLILAGRAYNDAYGVASFTAVKSFDARARELGSIGISWWDLQHAVKLPECWKALQETRKFNTEEQMTDYSQNAILLYTKTAGWTNKAFHGVIGFAGQEWDETNDALKPIETQCAAEGKPFMALWNFTADWYSYKQFMGDDAHWPPLASDLPYKTLTGTLSARDPKVLFIRVMTFEQASNGNKPEQPLFLSYAAQTFIGRISDWLNANKPNCKLVLLTSFPFIRDHADQLSMMSWVRKYDSAIEELATTPLASGAYPQSTDKPDFWVIDAGWKFWYYYKSTNTNNDFMIFNGNTQSFLTYLGAPVVDTTPPTIPAGLASSVSNGNVILTWSPSTDGGGVAGYRVYRDGVQATTTTGLSVSFSNQPSGTYVYGISAFDTSGNESAKAALSVVVPQVVTDTVTRAEFDALKVSTNQQLEAIIARMNKHIAA